MILFSKERELQCRAMRKNIRMMEDISDENTARIKKEAKLKNDQLAKMKIH